MQYLRYLDSILFNIYSKFSMFLIQHLFGCFQIRDITQTPYYTAQPDDRDLPRIVSLFFLISIHIPYIISVLFFFFLAFSLSFFFIFRHFMLMCSV